MLQEEASAPSPTITITGTPLAAFSSEPGTVSTEQSYAVSGSNLGGDITINAPADFQVSTTSGSGLTSSLTLTQSGGSVSSTTIYVRFNRGHARHIQRGYHACQRGATTQNVTVNGTASAPGITPCNLMVRMIM